MGVQVFLYKGRNASALNSNNYRGITLLSSFNKLFEVILWQKIHTWWDEKKILTPLQGACRKGVLRTHNDMLLQEKIAANLEKYP